MILNVNCFRININRLILSRKSFLHMSDTDNLEKFKTIQSTAKKPSIAQEIKTLVTSSNGYGVISTNSDKFPGFPTGSVVGFACEEAGMPFFALSSMSAHTRDIMKDPRCSLTVNSKNFKDASDGRVNIIGTLSQLPADKVKEYREIYLKKHKNAYWIDFGDFKYFLMDNIVEVRYVGGFAQAGAINGEDYLTNSPDPLAAFSEPVMNHMNDDHTDSLVAMAKHYLDITISDPKIIKIDQYGMTIRSKIFDSADYADFRLPFPRLVTERKEVKEVIVEMTKASSSSL